MSGSGFHRFSDVDASEQTAEFTAFLDRVRVFPGSLERRGRTYAKLRLAPGQRVLDAGCGLGDDTRELAQLVAPGEAVGVDLSEQLLAEAQRRNGAVPATFVGASVDALPFEDASFDAYRAERLHQHLQDPAAAVAEAARVLRPDGRIAILDQDWGGLLIDGDDRLLTRRIVDAFGDSLANGWSGRTLDRLLRDAGFATEVEVLPAVVPAGVIAAAAAGAALAAAAIDREQHDVWLEDVRGRFSAVSFVLASGVRR